MPDVAVEPVPVRWPRPASMRALRPLSPKTKDDYRKVLIRAYGPAGPQPNVVPDIEAWPESTRRILRAALRSFWAHYNSPETGENVADKIPFVFVTKKKMQFPTEAEMVAFETAAQQLKPRFKPLMLLLAKLGLRAEELLTLTREQVERALATGEMFFMRKGGEEGSLPIENVRGILQDLLVAPAALPHPTEKVLMVMLKNSTGGPSRWEVVGELLASATSGKKPGEPAAFETRYNLLLRLVKKTAKSAGLDPKRWTPHKLRHGFATRMNRDGAPAATIQRALAHKNLTTTQKYIHADVSDVNKYMRR